MQQGQVTAWRDVCSQCHEVCEATLMTVALGLATGRFWGTLTKRLSLCCNSIVVAQQVPVALGTPVGEA